MSDNLKTLIKKRSSIKSKLTIFNNYLMLIKSSPELSELQRLDLMERFRKFENLYNEFDDLQNTIELLSEDAESTFTEREDFDRQYFNLVALTRSLLGASSNGTGSEAGFKDADSGAHISNSRNFIRLPKIDLPHFDGTYQCWLEFRDTFTSLIHNNTTINDINKFHYLRASLQGNAALIIKNIDFKGDHYNIAWDLLCERYNNNRILVNNHIQALFDVESITNESSVSIRNLVDTINKNVRALTTLNQPTQYWDTLLIYIMSKKLDLKTSRDWEEHRNNTLKDDPTLAQFCSFLNKKADWLESVESNINLSQNNIIVALNNNHSNKFVPDKTTQIPKKSNNNFNKCPLCSQAHALYKCDSFRSLSIESRIQKANDYNVCLNCLRLGHSAKQCKLSHCKYCKIKHNTLLHLNSNDFKTVNSLLSSLHLATSNVALPANCLQLATSAHVLLSTALVNVIGASGKKYTARLLLDNGSTANFVTQTFFEKLGLLRRGTSTRVTDASEKAYGACLYIRSSSDNGSTNVQLLVSRNRIAPVKPMTIPRLELCGALLGARLCTKAKSKWFSSRGEVKPGSLVLIKDKTTPPLLWSLGRVTQTFPGVDGVTRVAEIKTKRGTIRRAFKNICPLPDQD
ncbi:uncharacterized protein LOC126779937 isoform X1 [Nymphalis io]|uniref:uncharacterized protein LOC126779937 isoform X1 n=1 Tax=Inachis io TaxID=171585 RepID=UPI002168AE9C|nr:uncharacterized protein LOC126779937 isoform X1 [Nymphalis io]